MDSDNESYQSEIEHSVLSSLLSMRRPDLNSVFTLRISFAISKYLVWSLNFGSFVKRKTKRLFALGLETAEPYSRPHPKVFSIQTSRRQITYMTNWCKMKRRILISFNFCTVRILQYGLQRSVRRTWLFLYFLVSLVVINILDYTEPRPLLLPHWYKWGM